MDDVHRTTPKTIGMDRFPRVTTDCNPISNKIKGVIFLRGVWQLPRMYDYAVAANLPAIRTFPNDLSPDSPLISLPSRSFLMRTLGVGCSGNPHQSATAACWGRSLTL